jgi:hypothetical protein
MANPKQPKDQAGAERKKPISDMDPEGMDSEFEGSDNDEDFGSFDEKPGQQAEPASTPRSTSQQDRGEQPKFQRRESDKRVSQR